MKRVALTLLLGLTLVLAGCSSAPGGSESSPLTTDDTTTETAVEGDYPSGLSASGVTDAEAFAAVHEEALSNRSYTYTREATVTAVNYPTLLLA